MSPYLLTITFLTLLAILTSSEVKRFVDQSIIRKASSEKLIQNSLTEEFLAAHEIAQFRQKHLDTEDEQTLLEENQPDWLNSHLKQSVWLKFNFALPPNNSRLNFYPLLHESRSDTSKTLSSYEVAARLIRHLYENEDFFRELPNAEYAILDKLIEKQEETEKFTFPDQLSSIVFDDSVVQNIFYHMLKGSKHSPSLLNFISFDSTDQSNDTKINLMFASGTLLEAIFQNNALKMQVAEARDQLWKEILNEEAHFLEKRIKERKSRQEWKQEIQKTIHPILTSSQLDQDIANMFDYSLGKIGNILMIQDPRSGRVIREKYRSYQ